MRFFCTYYRFSLTDKQQPLAHWLDKAEFRKGIPEDGTHKVQNEGKEGWNRVSIFWEKSLKQLTCEEEGIISNYLVILKQKIYLTF